MEKLAKEKEVVGIYISGHPLDDYKFEMQYYCNSKLETLKNLEQHVNKNLAFGGIITNVQHRVAKNGKGWGMFTLEGYDESYEFRIFGEEYLKFRHFLIQNNFTFMKVLVKEGWADKETGKKGEPRLQFLLVQYLQDVLPTFAKKLVVKLDINNLQTDLIQELNAVFQSNKGDNQVVFEVLETEKIIKQAEEIPIQVDFDEVILDENGDLAMIEDSQPVQANLIEETRTITRIEMPSRKLKIKISNELLQELVKLQINFKLN
jgi:DNA polymerase-3 subunit alpha